MARFQLRTLARTPGLTLGEGAAAEERLRFSKQLAVLIYLASRPQARATREELIGLLWEGSSPHDARQALRQVVYQIRHGTDRDLVSGDQVLVLRSDFIDYDVDVFRAHLAGGRLREAYQVYETDFLSNVALSGAREFEQWAEGIRQQLAAEWRQLLRSLVATAVDGGNWADAAQYSARLIERDPYDLEPRIKMVELLALAGDEVRAQAAAEEVRRVAVEIHGERIPAVVANALARAISPTAVPDRRQSRGFPRHPELVGRAAEFRAVVDRWRSAIGGEGGAVLISGEAGIGKTRLARDLERRFQRDPCLVLKSACHTAEQSDPLAPFLEMLREAQAAPGLGAASPPSLEVLGAFIPEIAGRFTGTITPRPAPIPREALAASVLDAYAAIAGELPLALVVEDLDRATPTTVEFVHRLARRAQSTHLLVLVTARDIARVPETGRALRDLTGGTVVTEVALAPLDATDVRHFIGSIATLPDGAAAMRLAEQVARQTAGVPFYVLELLKALYDGGELQVDGGVWRLSERLQDPTRPLPVPESTEAILQKRLEVLGDRPLQVFAALAVRERETSVQDLAYLTGFEMEAVRAALNALERRRLIARQRGMPAVLHDELAAAALQRVSHSEARRFHQRAAELSEQGARLGRATEWSVAAHHAAVAGDIDRATVNAAHAAAAAEQASGHESARETLQTVLDSMPQPVREELQTRLAPILRGKRSPRSWLKARSRRRSAWKRYGVPAASAVVAVAAFATIRAAVGALGGGTASEPAAAVPFAAEVRATWELGVDSLAVIEPVFPESLVSSASDPLRIAGGYDAHATSISPAGDRVVAVRQGVDGPEIVLLSVQRGVLGRIDWCRGSFAVSWRGDGGRLACAPQPRTLALGDAAPGSQPLTVELPAPITGGPVWSPDGAWVAVRLAGDSVYVVDRAGRQEPTPVPGRRGVETVLRWEREP